MSHEPDDADDRTLPSGPDPDHPPEAEAPPGAGGEAAEGVPAEEESAPTAAEPEGDGPDLTGARVLVIEDEAPVANFVAEYFTRCGAQVIQAADGARGLELFESERPDLALCDLLLPKRNGFQLLEDMAESAPDTPVVIMSGVYHSEKYLDELPHARAFLDKPLELNDLRFVAAFLAEHRAGAASAPREKVAPPDEGAAKRRTREPWIPTRLVPLARLLHLLWRDERTGLLTHRNGDRQTVFMLKEGQIHFVRCNDPELGLGKVLMQLGKVRADDLDMARAALENRTTPTRLGEVLIQLGLITQGDLKSAVQLQLRKVIAGAFDQADGETLFHEETRSTDEDIALDTDTRAVIIAGCAAFRGEAEELLGHLPDGRCLVQLNGDPADPALKLPATERRFLAALEGPLRLDEVAAMAKLMGLRPRPLLFGLLCADVLSVVDSGAEWESHAPRSVGLQREIPEGEPPAVVLMRLESERATGTLTVDGANGRAWLAFEKGRLCGAGSDEASSRLGERLLASGLIDAEQLKVGLEVKARCPRKPLGRVFVEMGALEPGQLLHAVRAQLLGIATDLVMRREWGATRFEPGRHPDSELIELGLSTADVVLEGLRRMDPAELERLAGRLASGRPQLDLKALTSDRFSLSDTEEMVAGALSRTVESLLRSLTSADQSDPDVLRMLVVGLLVSPVVEPVETT